MKDYINSHMAHIIDEHIHNEKHRKVLKLHFVDGWTYQEIADEIKMSPRNVGYVIANNVEKIERLL